MPVPGLKRKLLLALAISLSSQWAFAQPHETKQQDYILRSSTVSSMNIDERTAARHGIERRPTRGILNVTVLKRDGERRLTVPATVSAHVRNLAGVQQVVPLAGSTANGRVSYTGQYDFAPREVLDFTITAQPGDSSRRLKLRYRERMWARQ